MFARSRSLSVLGRSYEDDWAFIVASFVLVFIALCGVAGVCYYWMVASVFPENLVADPINAALYTSEKDQIVQTQAYLQRKQEQFDAATGGAAFTPAVPKAAPAAAAASTAAATGSPTTIEE